MRKAYVVAAKRSAIGSFLGGLTNVKPVDLGATVLKETIKASGLDAKDIDECIIGNVISAGLGQNIARQVALGAGIPETTCSHSLNMVCGSGLKAVMEAVIRVQAGFGDVFVAGGVESMSNAPILIPGTVRTGMKMGNMEVIDSMINDGLTDAMNHIHMGVTAENIAKEWKLTREMQDEFALNSQLKAEKAIKAGRFVDEIVPVIIPQRKGEPKIFEQDEFPRFGSTIEKMSKLKPSFIKGGTVTAANASGINDGAAAFVVMSAEKANELGLKPMAKIVSYGSKGLEPSIMGYGPFHATKKALEVAGLTVEDMDLIEANEAFAAQSLAVAKDLNFDMDKVNVNGGAIALGHPVGASGARILVTLLHEMEKRDAKKGLATLCIGGGMGTALVVERI